MPIPTGPARWFRRPAQHAVWRETLRVRGGGFDARLRICDDGGCVLTLPTLPQLRVRGATVEHARLKALILIERYLQGLAAGLSAAPAPSAGQRQESLPLAA